MSRIGKKPVSLPQGVTATVSGQTVTVTIPTLNPGDSVTFSIFTTVLQGANIDNTACVTADGFTSPRCATASVISELPRTGEQPLWSTLLKALLIAAALGGVYLLLRRSRGLTHSPT